MIDRMKILEGVVGAKNLAVDDMEADASRCVATRNAKITCRQCTEMCPAGAISLEHRRVEIDSSSCTHCGACATVCPTQALSSSWFPRKELVRKAIDAVDSAGGRPVLACAKACEGAAPDTCKVVRLECLEAIDEALLITLFVAGAREARLVTGDCLSCETGCLGAVWTLVADRCNEMLGAIGFPGAAVQLREIPEDVLSGDGEASAADFSRRDLFGGFRERASRVAGDVMGEVREDERYRGVMALLGMAPGSQEGGLAEASRGEACARAVRTLALRRERELGVSEEEAPASCMERLGGEMLPSRIFSDVEIDGTRCTSCFLCAAYCQTGALEKHVDGPRVLGFSVSPWLCTQCGACVDICKPRAISLTGEIRIETLLAERPERILYSDWK